MATVIHIERSISGVNAWTVLTLSEPFPTVYVDNTAVQGEIYDYRAKLINGAVESAYSSISTVLTLGGVVVSVPETPVLNSISLVNNDAVLTWSNESAKVKVVFLGSSTTEGVTGLTDPSQNFVSKVGQYLTTIYSGYEGVNLGLGGTNSYHIMPTGNSVANRPAPDTSRNITYALSLNPDVIVVNMPSNDIAQGYTTTEFIDNLKAVRAVADSAGVAILFTTTQPRNFETEPLKRAQCKTAADIIINDFGTRCVPIYYELADSVDDYRIKNIYDSGDEIHLTAGGHTYIANTVNSKIEPLLLDIKPDKATGFKIYKGTDVNSMSLLTQVGEVFTYTDTTVVVGSTYHYKVAGTNLNGDSSDSNIESVVLASLPTMKINIAGPWTAGATLQTAGIDSTWHNIFHDVETQGAASFVINGTTGIATPYTLHAENATPYRWGISVGYSSSENGPSTGDNSGIVPDNVMKHFWFANTATDPDGGNLRISGMPVGSNWKVEILGARAATDGRTSKYTIEGVVRTLNCANNTTTFALFESVTIPASGELNIQVIADSVTTFGYLNALIITPI